MSSQFNARFFDGIQIQPYDAVVVIDANGLTITPPNKKPRIFWPAKTLQIMERPLGGRSAVIASTSMEGARLIVSDQAIYQSIFMLVPSKNIKLSQVHHPWRKVGILSLVCVAISLFILWGIPKSAPYIAKTIPFSWDDSLGQFVIKTIANDRAECISPEGRAALNKIMTRLTQNIALEHPFDIRVIKFGKDEVNAFAVPGYHIVIMSGFLQFAENPDELGGVLAHEMGHALQHHPTTSVIRQLTLKAFMLAAFGSSMDFASQIINLGHSRQDELKADEIAVALLGQANISTQPFIHFFEKIKKSHGDPQLSLPLLQYISTHPALQERIDKIKTTPSQKGTPPILNPTEWRALKDICNKTSEIDFNTTENNQK